MVRLTQIIESETDRVAAREGPLERGEFAGYVCEVLFPPEKYVRLQPSFVPASGSGGFPGFERDPDLRFRTVGEDLEFYVETRYLPEPGGGALECCEPYALERFRQLNATIPVFIAIGTGGSPANPERVFLVPVGKMMYSKLYRSVLHEYEVDPRRGVDGRLILGALRQV
jgi:hypothetical protein